MRRAVQVLCRPELGAGFALAGLEPRDIGGGPAAAAAIRATLDDPDAGVLLVEDRWYEALPDDLQRQLGRRPLPMVVPFPGPAWAARPDAAEAYIIELLRQVIGYRVRLR